MEFLSFISVLIVYSHFGIYCRQPLWPKSGYSSEPWSQDRTAWPRATYTNGGSLCLSSSLIVSGGVQNQAILPLGSFLRNRGLGIGGECLSKEVHRLFEFLRNMEVAT